MIKEGRMTPEGLKFFEDGKKKPVIDKGIPKNPEMPIVLKKVIAKNKDAEKNFDAFPK